jgi:5-(carboxyamino)imidazole ribonucleotide mutase
MNSPKIGIIMGSKSDLSVMQDAADLLKELGVDYEITGCLNMPVKQQPVG